MKILVLLVVLGLVYVTSAASSKKNTFYGTNSAFRAKLPSNAPISSKSDSYVDDLLRQISYTDYVWINTNQYSVPIYYASADQAKKKVKLTQQNAGLQEKCNNVPIPSGAKGSAGSDSSIFIYQSSTDTAWEFWQFKKVGDSYTASWGDMENVSKNPGFFKNPHPNYGTSATSIGLVGGIMTVADAKEGKFPYALRLTLQDHARGVFVSPALRTDGNGKSPIPEGTRFRLPSNFNVSSISNKFARMVAQALKDYGMITADTSQGVCLYAEDTTQYEKNEWPSIWGANYPSSVMNHIPWDKLEVVDPSWQPWNRNNSWYQSGNIVGPKRYQEESNTAVFTDSYASGWQDYSWAPVSIGNYGQGGAKFGSKSIKATITGANAFYLHNSNIDTGKYNGLSMWIYGDGSSNDLKQQLNLAIIQLVKDGKAIDGMVRLGSLFKEGIPSKWTRVTVRFSELGYSSGSIHGFWIQGQMVISGSSNLYIDDIKLVKVTAVN